MDDIKDDNIMLTVFLRHDQAQALNEFQTKLDERGWWENFPPERVEIVSWNVVMGIGQIVTLRFPPERLQAVNVALEKYAWGVFRTEAYVSYDFVPVRDRLSKESRERRMKNTTGDQQGTEVNSEAGGGTHPRLPHNGLFLEQWQAGSGTPTEYEMNLGDALEAIFGEGIQDIQGIVQALNERGSQTPNEELWTEENFPKIMKRLGR